MFKNKKIKTFYELKKQIFTKFQKLIKISRLKIERIEFYNSLEIKLLEI